MYRLYIVRHAEADSGNGVDFDRPLSKAGEHQATELGHYLKLQHLIPELILPSPAHRTLSTGRIIAKSLEIPSSHVISDPRIYQADLNRLLEVLRELDSSYHSVMLVGHNPGVSLLYNYLAEHEAKSIPNCGLSVMDFDISSWEDLAADEGKDVALKGR